MQPPKEPGMWAFEVGALLYAVVWQILKRR